MRSHVPLLVLLVLVGVLPAQAQNHAVPRPVSRQTTIVVNNGNRGPGIGTYILGEAIEGAAQGALLGALGASPYLCSPYVYGYGCFSPYPPAWGAVAYSIPPTVVQQPRSYGQQLPPGTVVIRDNGPATIGTVVTRPGPPPGSVGYAPQQQVAISPEPVFPRDEATDNGEFIDASQVRVHLWNHAGVPLDASIVNKDTDQLVEHLGILLPNKTGKARLLKSNERFEAHLVENLVDDDHLNPGLGDGPYYAVPMRGDNFGFAFEARKGKP